MGNRLIFGIIGFVIGLFVYSTFFVGEVVTKTITKHVTDTTYVDVKDTVFINKSEIIHRVLRDTVYLSNKIPISRFTALKPILYGDVSVSGEVAGEVLSIDVTGNFKIPTVTNTITTNTTKKIAPKGLYLGADLNNLLVPSPSAYYLDDKWLFKYSYTPTTRDHSVGVAFRVF